MVNLESSQAYPIRRIKRSCDSCSGRGFVVMDAVDFINYLEHDYRGNKNCLRFALEEYRQWKKDKTVTCPECLGAYQWEEPR